MAKVSVVMPAYNAEKYIDEAIDSILRQTFSDFEFIIIDDGSTDDTVNVVKHYTDTRIRFFQNEHNMGVAATLNRGLDLATGTYIARMDADDISLPQRLEKQVAFMDSHPDVAVVGAGIRLFGAKCGEQIFSKTHDLLKIDSLFSNCLAHPTVMMRTSHFGCGKLLYDKAYNKIEDFDLWIRVSEQYKLASIPEVLLLYRIHAHQVTQQATPENKTQLLRLKSRQLAALGINPHDKLAEPYYSFCTGEFTASPESIVGLSKAFNLISDYNNAKKIYNAKLLSSYLSSIMYSQLSHISWKQTFFIAHRCNVFPRFYFAKRLSRNLLLKIKKKFFI